MVWFIREASEVQIVMLIMCFIGPVEKTICLSAGEMQVGSIAASKTSTQPRYQPLKPADVLAWVQKQQSGTIRA